jgi:hypothetical protein
MLQVASSRSAVRPGQPFDHAAYDSGSETWAFSNDAPFEVDTVWLKNMPHYGYRRYDRMLARWQATQLIRPTPSAVDGYRIGQIDGRTAYTGQVLPANGHIHVFAFFGAAPQSVLYDNDRCLVAKILPDGTRKRASLFSGFLSHYLIRDRYGRPGKGNDKGKCRGFGGLFTAQLHGADAGVRDLGSVQPLAGGAVTQAPACCPARRA